MTTPVPGHNRRAQLLAFVDRLVRLEDEKKAFSEDITELKKEAKGMDFDPKTIVALAKLKRKGQVEAKADLELYESYLDTLGWLS